MFERAVGREAAREQFGGRISMLDYSVEGHN